MSKPAYFFFDAVLTNPDGMAPYLARVEDTVKAFGGERIVMGAPAIPYEGNAPKGIVVLLKFPSLDLARNWYASPDYQAIIGHRHASASCDAFLIEGSAG